MKTTNTNLLANVVTMHNDTASSDTTLLPGPGSKHISVSHHNYLATFTTLLNRSDGHIMALTSSFSDVIETITANGEHDPLPEPSQMGAVNPQIWVLNRDDGTPMGEPLNLMGGAIMGGIYAYLEQSTNTLVMAASINGPNNDAPDQNGFQLNLIRVSADEDWNLSYDATTAVPLTLDSGDFVVAISPDNDGDIWFSTAQNKVGLSSTGKAVQYYDPMSAAQGGLTGHVPPHQTVNNSFSVVTTLVNGTETQVAAIATNQTLQLFTKDADGIISLFWQTAYDAGTRLKPGQLKYPSSISIELPTQQQTWGTGATPTFFGPTGSEYVMITDNKDDELNLLVWKTDQSANAVVAAPLSHTLFTDPNVKGTENSAIGYGNSVVISSTYGYPYPVPKLFLHKNDPFYGGLTRVDISEDPGTGALQSELKWERPIRSSAVPKLSAADGKVYTMSRRGDSNVASPKDYYAYTVIDFSTGEVEFEYDLRRIERHQHDPVIGDDSADAYSEARAALTALFGMDNPLQMASCIAQDSQQRPVLWQGTMDGFFRVQGHTK